MSDPAFKTQIDATEFTPISDVRRDPAGVYLFDFDGVIVSGIEDHIYRLDERPGESALLAKFEDELDLRIGDMEFRYRRHLLFQEIAARKGIDIPKGAGFDLAKWASDNARFFVLTARSGWAATARARGFLDAHSLKPIELYQVGRVHKDRQVARTVEEFPNAKVYYIEDSVAHLARSAALRLPSLTPVHCSDEIDQEDVKQLYRQIFLDEVGHGSHTQS